MIRKYLHNKYFPVSMTSSTDITEIIKSMDEFDRQRKEHPLAYFIVYRLYNIHYEIYDMCVSLKYMFVNGLIKQKHKIKIGSISEAGRIEYDDMIERFLTKVIIKFVEEFCAEEYTYTNSLNKTNPKDGLKHLDSLIKQNKKENNQKAERAYKEIKDAYVSITTKIKELEKKKEQIESGDIEFNSHVTKTLYKLKTKAYNAIINNREYMW